MTKLHEEVFRGTVSEALEHFSNPRGEFTLVVAGLARGQQAPTVFDEDDTADGDDGADDQAFEDDEKPAEAE